MNLQLGDNMYELKYTVNSLCELEEVTGKNLSDIIALNGFSSVRALLWCGLCETVPGLTMKQAGLLLQEYTQTSSLEELVNILGGAIEQAGFLGAQGKKKPR
jgi:hypothetical protein